MTPEGDLWINGRWRAARGGALESRNPATGEVLWQGRAASAVDTAEAAEAAAKARPKWAARPLAERSECLKRFQHALEKDTEAFAVLISRENGKPLWESKQEVRAMTAKVDMTVKAFEERTSPVSKENAGIHQHLRFKPHGAVAVFGPFNLPGHLPNGHIVPALLAGNTVVFKPSEQTPLVGFRMAELWQEAGLEPGVFNLVQGARETGEALAGDDNLDGLFFTGSSRTGCALHERFSGRPEKILALEMGGNNPLIVHQAGDLCAAAYWTIQSAFITSGQRCVCARRLILVEDAESGRFLETLIAMMQTIKVGAFDESPEPFMGPVISNAAAQGLLEAQEKLHRAGGRVLVPMKSVATQPAFLKPGLMDVTGAAGREDAEIFGPFLQMILVQSFEEALREANHTAYGLSAGLLSDRAENYERFLAASRAGIVNWNRPMTGASSAAPFGGIGKSGNHRPSAYFAVDYCSYPVASLESDRVRMPEQKTPGLSEA